MAVKKWPTSTATTTHVVTLGRVVAEHIALVIARASSSVSTEDTVIPIANILSVRKSTVVQVASVLVMSYFPSLFFC